MKRSRRLQDLQRPQSLLDYLRQFLTPRVWKQARAAWPRHRTHRRWDLQPLVLIVLAMTWAAGDSQPEKFAMARGFYVASHRARKRPGRTIQGFQKAPSRLPLRPLRALAAGGRAERRAGGGRGGGDPPAVRRAVAGRRLRADGLRRLADRVPAHCRAGGPAPPGR